MSVKTCNSLLLLSLIFINTSRLNYSYKLFLRLVNTVCEW
jgi:hypothetical protein